MTRNFQTACEHLTWTQTSIVILNPDTDHVLIMLTGCPHLTNAGLPMGCFPQGQVLRWESVWPCSDPASQLILWLHLGLKALRARRWLALAGRCPGRRQWSCGMRTPLALSDPVILLGRCAQAGPCRPTGTSQSLKASADPGFAHRGLAPHLFALRSLGDCNSSSPGQWSRSSQGLWMPW